MCRSTFCVYYQSLFCLQILAARHGADYPPPSRAGLRNLWFYASAAPLCLPRHAMEWTLPLLINKSKITNFIFTHTLKRLSILTP